MSTIPQSESKHQQQDKTNDCTNHECHSMSITLYPEDNTIVPALPTAAAVAAETTIPATKPTPSSTTFPVDLPICVDLSVLEDFADSKRGVFWGKVTPLELDMFHQWQIEKLKIETPLKVNILTLRKGPSVRNSPRIPSRMGTSQADDQNDTKKKQATTPKSTPQKDDPPTLLAPLSRNRPRNSLVVSSRKKSLKNATIKNNNNQRPECTPICRIPVATPRKHSISRGSRQSIRLKPFTQTPAWKIRPLASSTPMLHPPTTPRAPWRH